MALAYDLATQFVAVALKRSRIDGYGVFAAEDIPAGTRLGLLTGESITVAEARRRAQESRRLMLVELSPARAIDASRSRLPRLALSVNPALSSRVRPPRGPRL